MNLLNRTIFFSPWNERAIRGMDDIDICIQTNAEATRIQKNKKVISEYGEDDYTPQSSVYANPHIRHNLR